jgi:hypothetical protein
MFALRHERQEDDFIIFLLGALGCLGVLGAEDWRIWW